MSEKLGPVSYAHSETVFLGRDLTQHKNYSEETSKEIDKEIRRFLEDAEDRAVKILEDNKEKLVNLAEALLQKETLNSEEIEEILNFSSKGKNNGPQENRSSSQDNN